MNLPYLGSNTVLPTLEIRHYRPVRDVSETGLLHGAMYIVILPLVNSPFGDLEESSSRQRCGQRAYFVNPTEARTVTTEQLAAVFSPNAINNGSACSVLFLSTAGLFPAHRKILEHETQSSAQTYF